MNFFESFSPLCCCLHTYLLINLYYCQSLLGITKLKASLFSNCRKTSLSYLHLPTSSAMESSGESKRIRDIVCMDAIRWLESHADGGLPQKYGVFTSLPDVSELPAIFGSGPTLQLREYKAWFRDTVSLIFRKIPHGTCVIFLQSDFRVMDFEGNVSSWVDKSYLCSSAAEAERSDLLWHKMVLTSKDATTRSTGRPKYSHFLCYRKTAPLDTKISSDGEEIVGEEFRYRTSMFAVPDIFFRGEMIWAKGIGLDCCYVGLRFLRDVAKADTILDPFCGKGTVMAMANQLGMHAVGVEISRKRCRQALRMRMGLETMDRVSEWARQISLDIAEQRRKARDNASLYEDGEIDGDGEDDKDGEDEDVEKEEVANDTLAVEARDWAASPAVMVVSDGLEA